MTVAFVIAFSGSGAAEAVTSPQAAAAAVAPRGTAPDSCRPAARAIRFYRARTNELRHRFSRTVPDRIRWPNCYLARRAAGEWQARARAALERWRYLYDWRSWLPANWYALGSCETGYGGDPNFEHTNGRFTSAFGISWAEYDRDAAYNGAPPWRVRHAPRDQFLAALGHLARFGDGWGCPGP